LQQRGLPRAGVAQHRHRPARERGVDDEGKRGERQLELKLDHRESLRARSREIAATDHSIRKEMNVVTATSRSAPGSSPIWMRWKIASESVWVRCGMLPATRMVAPNSPRARAKASI